MPDGYMGKLLFLNLSTGEIRQETPDDSLYRDFIGGYGLGSRVVYQNQPSAKDTDASKEAGKETSATPSAATEE